MSALDTILHNTPLQEYVDEGREELDKLRQYAPRYYKPENAIFLGRYENDYLWYRIHNGVPEVDWYDENEIREEWSDWPKARAINFDTRNAALQRAEALGLPTKPFNGSGELPQIVAELQRLRKAGVCDGDPALVIDWEGTCFLVPGNDVDFSKHVLPHNAKIYNLLANLANLPKPRKADYRRQLQMHDLDDLTPEYLRDMADKIEKAPA